MELSGCVKVIVLFVDVTADEVELPQAPPYVMVPASLEEKVSFGVLSLSGVGTGVTGLSVGGVVSIINCTDRVP